jgi:hypothetical protein
VKILLLGRAAIVAVAIAIAIGLAAKVKIDVNDPLSHQINHDEESTNVKCQNGVVGQE